MANHKSALKKIRSDAAKRARNRYQHKTARTLIKRLRAMNNKEEAQALLKVIYSKLDRLARKNIIHWKKAANNKSKLAKLVASMAS